MTPSPEAGPGALAPGAKWIGAEKTSGLAFLEVARRAWEERAVLMIGRAPQSGIAPDEWHEPEAGGGWWDAGFAPDTSEQLAQLSTTSGTTGEPKAIAISRRAVSDTVARLVEHMELDSSLREYVGVPVTFSFGLARTRAAGAVGGSVYLPENGFRPDEIARMLGAGEINALSAVPTMLRTLIANPELVAGSGGNLRWLEIGSQYMSGDEKRAIRDLFPNAAILQHYGLTEASRSTFLRIDKAGDDELESVGRPVGDGDLRLDEKGRIEVRGSHLASGLLRDGVIEPLAASDGWLTTSDLGEINGGALFFRGRSDDVANIGGIKVSVEHFERGLARRLGTPAFGAACVMEDAQRGQKLGLAILPEAPENWRDKLAEEVAAAGLAIPDLTVAELDSLPRTDTGKVQRGILAEKIAEQPSALRTAASTSSGGAMSAEEQRIADIWCDVLDLDSVERDNTFFDLGGDSLTAIAVMLRMEQAGMPEGLSQQIFEGRSIAEIAASLDDPHSQREPSAHSLSANAINFTRGILVLIVIGAHWGPFLWTRAGALGEVFSVLTWPLFRFGTPGFAMVFGLGLGFFWTQTARNAPQRLKKRIWISLAIVGAGVATLALLRYSRTLLGDDMLGPDWPSRFFYDVLLFYTLAVASLYPLLRLTALARYPIASALAIMMAGIVVHQLAQPLADIPATGFTELGISMLTAGYSYPLMLSYVMAGMAAGLWVEANTSDTAIARKMAVAGAILAVTGIASSVVLGLEARWFTGSPTRPAIVAYVGIMLLIFAAAHGWQTRFRGYASTLFRVTVCLGLLSLPAYVLQGAAFTSRSLLEAAGVPDLIAVAVPVVLVTLVLVLAVQKAYWSYFGKSSPPQAL